ncbi:MAG: enoyl-CoA hydratase-related protein, partial [Caldimonas sp.]
RCPIPVVARIHGDCYAGGLGIASVCDIRIAADAKAMGFVHGACTADELDAKVDAIVATIVANGPMATRACKQLVLDVAGHEITPALRAETARRIADIRASAEGKEGVQSFLDKRKPNWVGGGAG